MQKITTLLITGFLTSFSSIQAQQIKFESTFDNARSLSIKQGKPLAILITIEPPVVTPNFLQGLNDNRVIEKFNSNFINYKVAREDTAASATFIRNYKIYRFPSFLFLDARGGIMFTDLAILSRPEHLLSLADRAVAASKEKSLVEYDYEFKSGTVGRDFLKSYIQRRQSAGITNNADLIEKYVSLLSVQDLNNYAEVLFILKAGPLVDSTAYKLAYTNRKIIDSIFRLEALPARVAMNNAIIANTMNSAIALKKESRAYAVANFTRSTWANNPIEGQKNWHLKMLQYYTGVKDTLNYLNMASMFYESYYMRISVDSVRRKDSINFEAARIRAVNNSSPAFNTQTRIVNADSLSVIGIDFPQKQVKIDTVKRVVSFTYPKDVYATELNNAAWSFYLMSGNNYDFLMKAMLWSRRSVELSQKAAFYDTYAHLLYKLKFYSEAESMQQKAIELGKLQKINISAFENEYIKIKNRSL